MRKKKVQGKSKSILKRRPSEVQYIAGGFFIIILVGAILLTFPFASRSGEWTNFLDSLFTATSATCVTGLVVVDTFQNWTIFGQLIILTLIQIGGMGFITIGVAFSMLLHKRIGLRQRDLMKESVNALELGGIVRLSKKIIFGTFIIEGIGAIVLSIRFIPEFGILKGIYYSIFHSISAFCNAGFDLMGSSEAYTSFTKYVGDPLVNITLVLLIVIGGLGFVVWNDLMNKKLNWKRYSLHTKLVLTMTVFLIVVGAFFLYVFEINNTIEDYDGPTKVFASVFGSVTARTAGFNTVDTGALTSAGKFITVILMFIGGSPGSTAGGIKTTTIAIIILYIISNLRGDNGCNVYGRKIGDEIIKKACIVFCINLMLGLIAILVIIATNPIGFEDVVFEVYSAISTVGMTTGITRDLNTVGRIVIIIMMYCGRVGSMTFVLSFMHRTTTVPVRLPEEKVIIG